MVEDTRVYDRLPQLQDDAAIQTFQEYWDEEDMYDSCYICGDSYHVEMGRECSCCGECEQQYCECCYNCGRSPDYCDCDRCEDCSSLVDECYCPEPEEEGDALSAES